MFPALHGSLLALVGCGTTSSPAPATFAVAHHDALTALGSPDGQATIWPLSTGPNAVVGRLELEPRARFAPTPSDTHEVLTVLAGHARLTIDGEEHAVGPGDTVTVPAGVGVSTRVEVSSLVAIQVLTGPDPGVRYASWKPVAPDAGEPSRVDRVGPFLVECTLSSCAIRHQGATIGERIWHHGAPADVLAPLGGGIVGVAGEAWLIAHHAGDGCPGIYEALCLVDGDARRSGTFGNCNAPEVLRTVARGVELTFPATVVPEVGLNRERQVVVVDALECSVTAKAP